MDSQAPDNVYSQYSVTKHYINKNGLLHCEDGPAVITSDGTQQWWYHGERHREDGPAVIYSNGDQYWYYHGERHREDGPAVIYEDGTQEWWYHGKQHREDGPAVIYEDGENQWWYKNQEIDGDVEQWCNERNLNINNLSDEDIFALQFYLESFLD